MIGGEQAGNGGRGAHAPKSDGMPVAGLLDHQKGSATPHGVVDHLQRCDKEVVDVVGLDASNPGPDVPVCRPGDDLASACGLLTLLFAASPPHGEGRAEAVMEVLAIHQGNT